MFNLVKTHICVASSCLKSNELDPRDFHPNVSNNSLPTNNQQMRHSTRYVFREKKYHKKYFQHLRTFDEGIAKMCKKLKSHHVFLSNLEDSTANTANTAHPAVISGTSMWFWLVSLADQLSCHFFIFLVSPQKMSSLRGRTIFFVHSLEFFCPVFFENWSPPNLRLDKRNQDSGQKYCPVPETGQLFFRPTKKKREIDLTIGRPRD